VQAGEKWQAHRMRGKKFRDRCYAISTGSGAVSLLDGGGCANWLCARERDY
jgi:hypothetical protein